MIQPIDGCFIIFSVFFVYTLPMREYIRSENAEEGDESNHGEYLPRCAIYNNPCYHSVVDGLNVIHIMSSIYFSELRNIFNRNF